MVIGRAGLADARVGEDAVAAVEPAVRAPGERVQGFVGVLISPAVEQDLRRAVGPVVAVLVGDEEELGAAPTQTPPKPTSIPLTRLSLSAKTFFESNLPSPLVSSKIKMRSCALSSGRRMGYEWASATQSRPRSSIVNPIG